MKKTSAPFKIFRLVFCVVFCVFALLPVYAALIVALTPYSNMLEAQLYPHYFEIANFIEAFQSIYQNVINSFVYAASATIVTTAIAIPAAYVLSRYRFKGRKAVSFTLMLTQMMAGIVVLPNLYKMLNTLNLLNNRIILILVYSAFNLALVVTILQGYFTSLPVKAMAAAVRAQGLPCRLSCTAGTYVCNDVFYRLLHRYRDTGKRVGFVHVPFLPEQGSPNLPLNSIVRALQAMLEAI